MSLLNFTVFFPLISAFFLLFFIKNDKCVRFFSLLVALITFVCSLVLLGNFNFDSNAFQFVSKYQWISLLNINYHVGLDGLSISLFLLTTLLFMIAVLVSFNVKERIKKYFFWLLFLEFGTLGVFISLDMFLFYVFWEIILVPMYFLVGVWGGDKKEYAAVKFFIYTLCGSAFLLIGLIALYIKSYPHTFDIIELTRHNFQFADVNGGGFFQFQYIVFLLFFIGFAVKIPVVPFHTWLPLVHVQAPTAISLLLAGILLKLGVYGLLRISFPLFPQATHWFSDYLIIFAFINVVYGALIAMVQKDIKRMIAYSSINHMGYVLLGLAGLNVIGFNGAIAQLINHGIISGALFLLIGVLYDRAHTRNIDAFGGIGTRMPIYFGCMIVTCMASLGLPGLSGFISEFLCFLGGFTSNNQSLVFGIFPKFQFYTCLSVLGILFTAAFFLKLLRNVFFGPLNTRWESLQDMKFLEILAFLPLLFFMILFGVYPESLLNIFKITSIYLSDIVNSINL